MAPLGVPGPATKISAQCGQTVRLVAHNAAGVTVSSTTGAMQNAHAAAARQEVAAYLIDLSAWGNLQPPAAG